MKVKNNITKDFIWNTLGTTFNSFNSLFFMIIVTRINGVNNAGMFTLGFSLACLFYIIGSYSGRAFQITDVDSDNDDSSYFYSKCITCILMLLIGLLYCFVRKYEIYKFSIIYFLIFYKFLEAFSEYSYAIIQKNDKLYIVGKSFFLKSIFSLLLFLIVDLITKNLIMSELIIIIINILVIVFYDIKKLKEIGLKIGMFKRKNVFNILKNGFYAFLFLFLTIYVINASKYTLDGLASNKLQTIYGIISMPATIMALFAQFVLQPFVLKLKKLLYSDVSSFNRLNIKLCLVIFVFGLFTLLFAYFYGILFLNLIYNIKLFKYKNHLLIILFGSTIYSLTVVLSSALTIMRHTFNQMCVFIITCIFAFFISKHLIIKYSLLGASYTYLLSMILLFVLYIGIYLFSLKKIRESDNNG